LKATPQDCLQFGHELKIGLGGYSIRSGKFQLRYHRSVVAGADDLGVGSDRSAIAEARAVIAVSGHRLRGCIPYRRRATKDRAVTLLAPQRNEALTLSDLICAMNHVRPAIRKIDVDTVHAIANEIRTLATECIGTATAELIRQFADQFDRMARDAYVLARRDADAGVSRCGAIRCSAAASAGLSRDVTPYANATAELLLR
jgi:hypothetical protein